MERTRATERVPGSEPLPGYRLLIPLGRGGFGEVWKCEAPGGLHKAIKFISKSGDQFRQELSAFERVRELRHPYLLMLERVELTGTEMVMVMELADCQLHDRFLQCRDSGMPGIPRVELLRYLRDAAEALDTMSSRHQLQHLDVKPENLFIVADHVKVGDYGLVRRSDFEADGDEKRGFTPRYTAPEVLAGQIHPRSDQYSLALVYYELLTGRFPYTGDTAQDLMRQHTRATPNLAALQEWERAIVNRALAKDPAERFPSCLSFIRQLVQGGNAQRSAAAPDDLPESEQELQAWSEMDRSTSHPTPRRTIRPRRLRPREEPPSNPFVGLQRVMPVEAFLGSVTDPTLTTKLTPAGFMEVVVKTAVEALSLSSKFIWLQEGTPHRNILTTLPAVMVPLKIAMVAERWKLTVQRSDSTRIVLWREAPPDPPQKPAKGGSRVVPPPRPPTGLEVAVHLPTPPASDCVAVGTIRGAPEPQFREQALADLPQILDDIRGRLQNLEERRAHPRHPAEFLVRIFPLYDDGVVGPPIDGQCCEVSMAGLRLLTPAPLRVQRLYVEFTELEPLVGQTIYVRILRTWQDPEGRGAMTAGRVTLE